MKKRWFVGLAAFLLTGILLLPQLAADMDFIFSRQFERITWKPVAGWAAILAGGKALRFYLLLLAAVGLLLLWILFTSTYLNYRSDMRQVTPDIITPCAAGQGQFGTAKWLKQDEIPHFFGTWKISRNSGTFSALLKAGNKDKEQIRHANIHID